MTIKPKHDPAQRISVLNLGMRSYGAMQLMIAEAVQVTTRLTPDEMRELAARLIAVADEVQGITKSDTPAAA